MSGAAAILARHERIALSISGGKDSTAAAWLLRPWWDRITFYHLSTGDLLPEVSAVVASLSIELPNLTVVRSDVAGWIAANGPPSDLVPHGSHPVGQMMAEGRRLSSRYACCGANLMIPLFERIKADGNTLLIRGSKSRDMARLPMVSGQVLEGIELYLPVADWSNAQVMAYLLAEGAPVSAAYVHFANLPECATCSAWWAEGRAEYLRGRHPGLFIRYQERMALVMDELGPVVETLARELRVLGAKV